MDFSELNQRIAPPDEAAAAAAKRTWDSVAKPLNSLGALEDDIIKIAALIGTPDVRLDKRGVIVMCADNGVVEEGVTQTGQEVTAIVAGNIAHMDTSVCKMAQKANASVIAVDMGCVGEATGALDRRIAPQTQNFTKGPAMTREQAEQAIQTGIDLVRDYREQGYQVICTGEMGIGNTTTSSAVAAVLLGLPVERVTGRGAGLSDAGLNRKVHAIKRGIEVNQPDPNDALDVLAKLGGFDIAGMAGLFLGGALYRVPIMVDGFISALAALVAARLCPASTCAMLASHVSAEVAAKLVLDKLGLEPLIHARMRLGEGTGAVCALPLLDMALAVYSEMVSFDDIHIEAYTPQEGDDR